MLTYLSRPHAIPKQRLEAVTPPPEGTSAPRESGLFCYSSFIPMDMDYDSKVSGVVVED